MGFFNKRQKEMAKNTNPYSLLKKYETSENKLLIASQSGDEKEIKKVMKEHHDLEYAMLYSNTPEYKRIMKKSRLHK